MSVIDDQQFCLRWNNFQAYITSQFEALRDDEDFVDVTLACEGQRLGAHKVVLSACSPFFKELFKTNPCPHPIIFMRDVEIRHVIALLEFMYAGEVNVAQAHLPGFLRTAESLQIRGLTDASKKEKDEQLNVESSTLVTENATSSSPGRTSTVKSKHISSPTTTTTTASTTTPTTKSQNSPSPSRAVTSTQERPNEESLLSPPPCKKLCNNKTDSESDGGPEKESDITEIDHDDIKSSYHTTQINPFALQTNKALHTEIDITSDLIEPKLELPDYSEDDTNQENPHSFLDSNEMQNSFTSLPSGMEIIPGTSGMGDITQDNQQDEDPAQVSTASEPLLFSGGGGRTRRARAAAAAAAIAFRRRSSTAHWLPLALDMTRGSSGGGNRSSLTAATAESAATTCWRTRDQTHQTNAAGRVVKLGEGIEVCEEQLRGVKWSDYRKLTRGLATILFSPMELATCSVTGQRWSRAGNGERPVKPALDRAKVQAIISYVATRFPMVEISRIKQVLAYKCKENSTAFKMKAIRYFGDQQIHQSSPTHQ